jgi:hypothetical protein
VFSDKLPKTVQKFDSQLKVIDWSVPGEEHTRVSLTDGECRACIFRWLSSFPHIDIGAQLKHYIWYNLNTNIEAVFNEDLVDSLRYQYIELITFIELDDVLICLEANDDVELRDAFLAGITDFQPLDDHSTRYGAQLKEDELTASYRLLPNLRGISGNVSHIPDGVTRLYLHPNSKHQKFPTSHGSL